MPDSNTCVKRVPAMLLSCEGIVACIVRQQMDLTYSNISVGTVILIDQFFLESRSNKTDSIGAQFLQTTDFCSCMRSCSCCSKSVLSSLGIY